MHTLVRAVAGTALVLALGIAGSGIAVAQPAPPPLTPADERAQLACVQRQLDLTSLPQQALADPAAFSLLVADAAQQCHDVRAAPAVPAVPSVPSVPTVPTVPAVPAPAG